MNCTPLTYWVPVHEDPVAFLRRHLSKVTKEEEESYWALSHHAVDSKTTTSQKYQDEKVLSIFQTNGISAGPDRVGIFPRTARLNHGCVAAFNSVYSWREDEQILGQLNLLSASRWFLWCLQL